MDDEFDVEALLTAQGAGMNDDDVSSDEHESKGDDASVKGETDRAKGSKQGRHMARIHVTSSDTGIHYNHKSIGSVVSFIAGIDEALANQ